MPYAYIIGELVYGLGDTPEEARAHGLAEARAHEADIFDTFLLEITAAERATINAGANTVERWTDDGDLVPPDGGRFTE